MAFFDIDDPRQIDPSLAHQIAAQFDIEFRLFQTIGQLGKALFQPLAHQSYV